MGVFVSSKGGETEDLVSGENNGRDMCIVGRVSGQRHAWTLHELGCGTACVCVSVVIIPSWTL